MSIIEQKRGFIPPEVVRKVFPNTPHEGSVAWTPGSTPPELILLAQAYGVLPPEQPTLDDIFQNGARLAAELYLTRTCGLNCEGCSVPINVRWAKETRQEVSAWMDGIRVLRERGLRAVKFIGGEVGTIPWLADIAGFAVREGLAVSIFTDGVPFLDDPAKFDAVTNQTGGEVLWMTSVDFVPPTEAIERQAGKRPDLARRFKSQRGINFIEMVKRNNGFVIGHMMVHQSNAGEIVQVYREVTNRGGIFSVGTIQRVCHLYQGRNPNDYTLALTMTDQETLVRQITKLIAQEDQCVLAGRRTIANSRAHLAATAAVGIDQNIGCGDTEIGPPAVFAVMPDGSLRGCPVIITQDQIDECPGCAYAVFRDGDPRWPKYLGSHGFYTLPEDRLDFPSLFYPHESNNFLQGILPWIPQND